MYCPRCGAKVADKETICPECMVSIRKPNVRKYCTNCGKELKKEAKSCSCGTIVPEGAESPKAIIVSPKTTPEPPKGPETVGIAKMEPEACPKCGKAMQKGWVSCPFCGWKPDVPESQPVKVETQNNDSQDENPQKKSKLPAWAEVLGVIFLALAIVFGVVFFKEIVLGDLTGGGMQSTPTPQPSSWTFHLNDSRFSSGYSATIRIYEESGSLWMDYNGNDFMNFSKSNISFTHKLLMYSKTVDGVAMYSSTCPAPFNKYMWGLSSDKQTLYYLTTRWVKFTR